MKVLEKYYERSTGVEFYSYKFNLEMETFIDLTPEDYDQINITIMDKLVELQKQKQK